ncbi:uncharacterized protein [Mobula birostris]|uniref:uncharacterized protein n=1 Tax=Mobula birostris TaxID=1983395 RepID=UPI003B288FCC
MNWVGGVRNRIKLRQQKRQQKEFFEKRKLRSKLKLLAPLVSPQQNSSVSWDLLTLHIVNRIAAKKESTEASNNVVQVDMKKDTKIPIRRHNIELPMSPCSTPSRIFLEESQHSMQKEEWSSRKHFTNTTNFRYEELSPVVGSNSMEYNVLDNSSSSMDQGNGFPLANSWMSAKTYPLQENLGAKHTTMWDYSCDNQELIQKHFIGDGRSSGTEVTEHDLLADYENLLTDHRNLPKHSNARLLQNSLMENSSHHSSNCGKYVSFSMQDAFPSSQNIMTEIATTVQNLTSYGRDVLPTQCYNLEGIQPVANFLCQEIMPNPYALIDNDFSINVPYNRNDMYRTSDGNDKVVAEDAESEYIFTEPKPNSFKESVEKDFDGNNSLNKQYLESSSEEFRIQKDIALGPEEAWRCLDYRRKELNNSPGSSQSPSYSPKETESCCSVFSDVSELDAQNVQFDASVVSKGGIREQLLDDKVVRENDKGQCGPLHENFRESNSTHRVGGEQKENAHQFVPSLMYCSSEASTSEQNVVRTSFHGQDAWTQTESSLTYMGWSNVAIQCNLSDVAESLFLSGKEVTNVEDD